MKRLLRSDFTQSAFAFLLSIYLLVALRTTRWHVIGDENMAQAVAGQPVIVAFWHERLALIPPLWVHMRRQGARGTPRVLVSRHRDGRFIAAVVRRFGVRAVHGSSSKTGSARDMAQKGGAAGVRALLVELHAGEHVLITPDGPRGPRRQAAPGVAQIAGLSGAPIVPVGAQTSRRRVLPSWDRMCLPLPFGRGVIVCGAPLMVDRGDWQAAVPAVAAALSRVADQADALCSGGFYADAACGVR